jgi:hypothetical protein
MTEYMGGVHCIQKRGIPAARQPIGELAEAMIKAIPAGRVDQ